MCTVKMIPFTPTSKFQNEVFPLLSVPHSTSVRAFRQHIQCPDIDKVAIMPCARFRLVWLQKPSSDDIKKCISWCQKALALSTGGSNADLVELKVAAWAVLTSGLESEGKGGDSCICRGIPVH
jgi:hypothetical protein